MLWTKYSKPHLNWKDSNFGIRLFSNEKMAYFCHIQEEIFTLKRKKFAGVLIQKLRNLRVFPFFDKGKWSDTVFYRSFHWILHLYRWDTLVFFLSFVLWNFQSVYWSMIVWRNTWIWQNMTLSFHNYSYKMYWNLI